MSHLKRSRPDSPGRAMLARIESHLRDGYRRALWQNRTADVEVYGAALATVIRLQKEARGQTRTRDGILALRRADKLWKRLKAA